MASSCRLLAAALSLAFVAPLPAETPLAPGQYSVFPERTKQTILGIGVEIQSDSIGSGNNGLPNEPIAVPHDLTPSERERFAREMLTGFRYLRLAGGLYWRGTDPEGKFLQPRWPSQLEELRQMMDTAGMEGVSFEYWSPAPFWKANQSYVALGGKDSRARNRLRPFAPGFAEDPVYKGDTARFFADFSRAVVTDIQTLKTAGIRTSMFGLQNEPNVNHSIYSTCEYPTSKNYVQAYRAVAGAIRAYDPKIMLFADTYHDFPKLIAPAMNDPEVAALVDAYVVHTVGKPSEHVRQVHAEITAKLPPRPWFQNEYEYLTGGATPDRCLNTVNHIMNSFQLGANPTWLWLHALKPIRNAEASGYSLGFWQSQIDPITEIASEKYRRWIGGPEFAALPPALRDLEVVSAKRGDSKRPGLPYNFIVNQPVTVYLAVEDSGEIKLEAAWQKTEFLLAWGTSRDVVYKRDFPRGKVSIPEHSGKSGDTFAAPHLAFVAGTTSTALDIQIGMNLPILVRSQAIALERKAIAVKPGHWIYNPYNWHAVGSFAKRIPWNSVAVAVSEGKYEPDARILAFKRPDGKLTIVVSNRHASEPRTFDIASGLPATSSWRAFRYTPDEAGPGTMGVPVASSTGASIKPSLPPRSWEFWVQD